ncbi:LD-carboxypeptidase [Paenibacillus sp. LHD-38]|uniref:S66 family peptidase n=1 Tax=Paenibacillus sp. LHD-38 TaxID=3072143 RepID=UPI00280EAA7F|nr:LD-carboxypeptidase [Paenibacillus sp. LHD-38]MDQ8733611.1 LD-carboxypeptidase [Paenibacillus sp. LHD-38]
MKADLLKPGDDIRIISPSRSMSIIAEEQIRLAQERLEAMGLTVSYAKNCMETDDFFSSSIQARIDDLHEAFLDSSVKGILTTIGGYNCNQLLRSLNYSIIASNPKRLCGYSDITALSNAVFAKTGLISYSGPHFSTFAIKYGNDYTVDYFKRMLMENQSIRIQPAEYWSDDAWFLDQENRSFQTNNGPYIINEGQAEGTLIGGNLCTLNLLQGTSYMPSLKDAIVFIEDDYESQPVTFDRDLQSLIHQPGFEDVKGLVIGRFQHSSNMTRNLLAKIISSKAELANIPVIGDLDFGHTSPMFTFPIGGRAIIAANGKDLSLTISE